MSKFEIVTQSTEQNSFYRRLSSILEFELVLHNGHAEEHIGISNDLESIVNYFHSLKCIY